MAGISWSALHLGRPLVRGVQLPRLRPSPVCRARRSRHQVEFDTCKARRVTAYKATYCQVTAFNADNFWKKVDMSGLQ
jgi:hypothetical protein